MSKLKLPFRRGLAAFGLVEQAPMDRAARRRAYRAEHAKPTPPMHVSTCKARRCDHSQRHRIMTVFPKQGRMTAAQRRMRNARRLNARIGRAA